MQRDGDAVGRDVDARDQQPQDACLLGGRRLRGWSNLFELSRKSLPALANSLIVFVGESDWIRSSEIALNQFKRAVMFTGALEDERHAVDRIARGPPCLGQGTTTVEFRDLGACALMQGEGFGVCFSRLLASRASRLASRSIFTKGDTRCQSKSPFSIWITLP